MKKNYLNLTIVMLLSISLTSCNEILGNSDNPTGSSTTPSISDNSEIIVFKDSYLEALLVQYFDKNLDYKLSKAEAAAVVDIQKIFEDNTYITSFDELQYFTRLKFIGEKAFSHCENLESITIPGSVEKITKFAFNHCEKLANINILEGVKEVESDAFDCCYNIENISIPSSVEKLYASSFYNPTKAKITIDPGNKKYDTRDNCNCIIETSTNTLIVGGKNPSIPSSIQNIGVKAFRNNMSLTGTLVLPNDLETIGVFAFEGCKNIEGISFNNKLKIIGNQAFNGCESLKSLILPESLSELGFAAFVRCSSLESVTIPGSIKTLEQEIFQDCSNLKKAVISEGVELFNINVFGGDKLDLLDLPSTITTITRSVAYSSTTSSKVIMRAIIPPTINTFGITGNFTTVYVPAGSVDAYKAAEEWKLSTIKSIDEL